MNLFHTLHNLQTLALTLVFEKYFLLLNPGNEIFYVFLFSALVAYKVNVSGDELHLFVGECLL